MLLACYKYVKIVCIIVCDYTIMTTFIFSGEPYVSNVGATRFFINYNQQSVSEMKRRYTYTRLSEIKRSTFKIDRFLIVISLNP